MVECQLPKLDVAGSSPVSRSIISTASANPALGGLAFPTRNVETIANTAPPRLAHVVLQFGCESKTNYDYTQQDPTNREAGGAYPPLRHPRDRRQWVGCLPAQTRIAPATDRL